VLSRDGSIEQRQLEELMTIQSFTVRAAYPNDAQCIAGISPDAEGMASFHPAGCLRQLTHSLRLQKGVYTMAERELLSWVLICSFRIGAQKLHMYYRRRIQKRTLPSLVGSGSYQGEVAIARAGGLNMRPALKCGTGAATRVGSVSPSV
jgi:hypothetical protein